MKNERGKKKNGWDTKILLDELFFELVNLVYRGRFFLKNGRNLYDLRKNIELKNKHQNQRCFVVGNGPSLAKQDLRLIKGDVSFFVNRAFLIPECEYIQPNYHIIIDPKFGTVEWPLTFLDQIVEKNPEVTFLLNAQWRSLPQFKPYLRFNIYWLNLELFFTRFTRRPIDLTNINAGGAVVEIGILAAMYMGIKDIYLLGVDGNGLLYNLLGIDSHVYGTNPEDIGKDMLTISKDLMFMSISFRRWMYLAAYCEQHQVNLVNATEGGILNIPKRAKYEKLVSSEQY